MDRLTLSAGLSCTPAIQNMFDEVRQTGFSVPLCILQLFGAPFAGMALGFLATLIWTDFLGIRGTSADLFAYVAYGAEGWLMGYSVQTVMPRATQSGGRWVWIIPICFFTWGLIDEPNRGLDTTLDMFITRPGRPASPFLMALITLPMVASCFYSLGIIAASRPAATALGVRLRKSILRSRLKALADLF